jgi:A-type KR domain-containing polyene macrolide polyketide synthase
MTSGFDTGQENQESQQDKQDKVVDYLRRVTGDLRRARQRIEELEREPIAVVGMGCRFPGDVRSPEDLWELVSGGHDAISPFPDDRGWDLPALAKGSVTGEGGFLTGAAEFDAGFFGISPREARAMDPQQRLLLEVSWEAIERAGIDPFSLRGSNSGVFIGAYHWGHSQASASDDELHGHAMTGTASSVLSGRLAYTLGLEGPAVTIDTACSSSLVALHLAARSLRAGESSLAVAGGVTVMSEPSLFVEFSKQGGLSADGRCKAFSDDADGTGWAEGVGAVVLERLSDAQRNGHPILAVVRGTAVNQDGASNGLTAPNGPSQQRVIRQALEVSGLSESDVDAVEAHGTGTGLGDPIEAQAILATYGRDRERPLWLGSLKSNIGHAQAAAGVGGVLKMVQALRHGVLPRTLHAGTPSSHVDWTAGDVRLLTEQVDWPGGERTRRAGVSSFGVSGTNAHAILEEAPAAETDDERSGEHPSVVPWVLSARGDAALRAQATNLLSHVDEDPVDAGYSLVSSRALFDHRAVVVGEPHAGLAAVAEGGSSANVVRGVADIDGKTVFVFPGQGSQWAGMGARLLEESSVFAERLAGCAAAIDPFVDWSLPDVLREADGAPGLDRVDVVQPASFAVMVSLAALWRAQGVEPDAVVGHSQGEIAAAVVSGALSLEDGARVVALRSQAIARTLAGAGGMMSIALPVSEVEERLPDGVSVAALNGPMSTVVSGDPDALDALYDELAAEDVRVKRVAVDYASHSAQVERLHDELLDALAPVSPRQSDVPFFSTVTDDWLDTTEMSAEYWYRNLRQTVRFEPAIRALLDQRHGVFIEVSSHPVLTMSVQEITPDAVVTGTLRRDQGGLDRFLLSAGEVFVRGVEVDWSPLFTGARRIDLPTYAFQHEHFWTAPRTPERAVDPEDAAFWTAVEQEDVRALTTSLDLDEEALAPVLPALVSWRRQRHERSTVESWRYKVTWKPLRGNERGSLAGTWLLVTADGIEDDKVAEALTEQGADVRRLVLDDSCTDRAELASRLDVADGVTGIVSVLAEAGQPGERHPEITSGLALTVSLVQALGDAGVDAPLWLLTRDAVRTGRDDRVTRPLQAQVLGVGWTAALEHSQRFGGVVDLPESFDERTTRDLATALSGVTGEDQLAIRPAGILARRVVRAPSGKPAGRWRPRGTVLVTGGTGAIGPDLARWLAAQGAEHVVLTSRRGVAAPGASELVAELGELGTEASVAACDVTDRDAVAALLHRLKDEGRPVRTVVHTATVIELRTLDETTMETFAEAVHAKVDGARNLDALLDNEDLDAFVLYSSTAGMWGSGRHAAYVAGNAFLSALAENRRARGLTALSVHWGKWPDRDGLEEVDKHQIRRSGLGFIDPDLALTGLRGALDNDDSVVAIAEVDWARYHPVFTAGRPATLFDDVPEVRALAEPEERTEPESGLAAELHALSGPEQERMLLNLVRTEAAAVLGHGSGDAVPERRAFRDAGFDSVTAVDLRNRLAAATGLTPPTTVVFDHPSPVALMDYLRAELGGGQETTAPVTTAPASGATDEPIAIVGMGCRFPGDARSPEDLWRLVLDGADAISEFPAGRGWDTAALHDLDAGRAGKTYSVRGGFVHDAGEFDAGFFGISPREAVAMDPQQRLLLETGWEAFERAGIDPAGLRGTATGTFIGSSHQGYREHASNTDGGSEGHLITGAASSVLSGRVAYLFGLEGPAVTVDTACSSSLVALHLACQSLRSGESSLALAGGSTVMANPNDFVGFSRLGALSRDGRCKAFAEDADGMSLSEGVGVVVLERLSDAERNGHRVLAVVRGSATNQDGASNGLTAPNGPSQQRVIRQALSNTGLSTSDVDAVEAHGTGTKLGDPIEAQALQATYCRDRAAPLWLGSLKSNIGHTQATAGIAGVIKMVQALRAGVLPPTLHAGNPSSHVDWTGTLRLITERAEWPDEGRPRRSAVSAFGISGTNAHVILEQAPEVAETEPAPEHQGVLPWLISATSDRALAEQARRCSTVDGSAAEIGWSLATTRASLDHRAVVLGESRADFAQGLRALANSESAPGLVRGARIEGDAGPVFVFPGQGSQWWGMGRELLCSSEVFATAVDECAEALAPHVDCSLHDVLSGEGDPDLLERVDVVQPALFSMMVALAALWRSYGCEPAAVVGHSQGEIAAAYVAGVLTLEDAARIVALRSKALLKISGRGGMVSVMASADRVGELLEPWGDQVSVAAINGPASVVVSGAAGALDELIAHCETEGVRARRVSVDYASHSAHVDDVRDELARVLAPVMPRAAEIPFQSTVTGERADGAELGPEYWFTNLRRTVRMEDATRALLGGGHRIFVEMSPHPVLGTAVEETVDAVVPEGAVVVGSLRRDEGGPMRFLTSLAEAYTHGATVDWRHAFPANRPRTVELPTYAFQRKHYWLEPKKSTVDRRDTRDGEFWDLVEAGDLESLAAELGVGENGERSSLGTVLPALSAWRERSRQRSLVDSLRYRVSWTRLSESSGPASGRWLVMLPSGADAEWLSTALGDDVVYLEVEDFDRESLRSRLDDIEDPGFTGVVSLLGSVPSGDAGVPGELSATLALVQALGESQVDAPLWCLTRGAVSVGADDRAVRPAQGTLWGLGRVVALEHPGRWGGLIDVPETIDERIAAKVAGVVNRVHEDQVAVRANGTFARRLVHAPPATGRPEGPWRCRGTVLVTGGTGGVGAFVARWAIDHGAEHVVLTSRRGPDAPGAAELTGELEGLGAKVTVAACDAGDRDALAKLLDRLPPTSVFHVAGVADGDAGVDELTEEQLAALLRSKLAASVNLHELTRDRELDAFVLFSSGAAVWGSGGQPGYAAANAFLDALAERRRAGGLPATAVAWGAWAEAGMATDTAVHDRLSRRGVEPMDPALALGAMRQALENGEATVTVTSMDWERFVPSFTATRPSPLLSELPEVREVLAGQEESVQTDSGGPVLRQRLEGLSEGERERALLDLVRAEAAATLGHEGGAAIPASRAFRDVGFDSVTAVELRNRLRAATGLPLPTALVFDYPTPTALAGEIKTQLFGAGSGDGSDPADPDAEIRATLASIPPARLRKAGLLDMVLRLAEDGGEQPSGTGTAPEAGSSLDDLDAESLLRLASDSTSG